MRTSNPALNEKVFDRQIEEQRQRQATATGTLDRPPVDDRVSPWTPGPPYATALDTMTVGGVVSASAVLLMLLLAAGWFGWASVDASPDRVRVPGWLFPVMLGGLGIAILTIFKPKLARFTAPVYAVVEGLLLGAISHLYEFEFDGIVLQAVGLTIGVFALLLFLYATRIIEVTENLRMGIVAATGAVLLVYVVSLVLHLFGADIPFIHDAGPVGILFSLVVVVIAALNLVLDFDFIERGAAAGAPKYMEWYGAFGLLITLVWLYLELLRLLAKLRSR
ncbi:MAG TPA: Bax inhibitor-1/YccA family protein [Acidimicrobiales bacterium]|nr:Bax inhibitor-1/YccA family protein [Acidimicrobiales bacterium]